MTQRTDLQKRFWRQAPSIIAQIRFFCTQFLSGAAIFCFPIHKYILLDTSLWGRVYLFEPFLLAWAMIAMPKKASHLISISVWSMILTASIAPFITDSDIGLGLFFVRAWTMGVVIVILAQSHIRLSGWQTQVLNITLGVQIIIALGQMLTGHSLGLTAWLGESVLSTTLAGVAKFRVDEILMLRGYGTLPHPNILGLVAWGFFFLSRQGTKSTSSWLSLLLGIISGSRMALAAFITTWKTGWIWILGLISLFGIGLMTTQSGHERLTIAHNAWTTLHNLLPIGIGQSAHITHALTLGILPDWLTLQPVHNTPLLLLFEIGVFPSIFLTLCFLWGLARTGAWGLIFFFLFDHALWTSIWGLYLFLFFCLVGLSSVFYTLAHHASGQKINTSGSRS